MRPLAALALVLVGAVLAAPAPAQDAALAVRGSAVFRNQGCHGCHTIGAAGTPIGPDLSRIGARHSPAYLARWLRDPAAQRPHAHMPALELTEADVQALAGYLATLR